MTREIALAELQTVIRRVLNNDLLVVSEATQAKDVPEWDSINHIELIVAVEKHFKVKFTAREIQSFRNVGEMCGLIVTKKG